MGKPFYSSVNMANILLIGCGYWGKNWYNTIKDSKYVLAGVVDPSPVIKVDVPLFQSMDEVNVAYTHAIIATNAELHYPIRQALTCNNILVEKPCGMDSTRQYFSDCFPGYIFLSSPQFKYIEKNLHSLGKIFYSNFHRASMGPRLRTDVSIIEDYAIHDLYIYQALFGHNKIHNITANLTRNFRNPIQEDSLFLTVESDHVARFFSSWVYPYKKRVIEIVGEHGSIIWDNDTVSINYSRYIPIDGMDSYRNIGYELIQEDATFVDFTTHKSNLHLQLDDFIDGIDRSLIFRNTDAFITQIKQAVD